MKTKKILLPESEMPTAWYNIVADMPNKPLPALDPKTRELAVDLINDYCKDGTTLLLVSHIDADRTLLCNREIKL